MDMACMHSLTNLVGWMEFMGYVFVWRGGGRRGGMGVGMGKGMGIKFTHSECTNYTQLPVHKIESFPSPFSKVPIHISIVQLYT